MKTHGKWLKGLRARVLPGTTAATANPVDFDRALADVEREWSRMGRVAE
jgi:hypothetical protein